MTAIRAVAHADRVSLSHRFKDYFACCYAKRQQTPEMTETEEKPDRKLSMTSTSDAEAADVSDVRRDADGASEHSVGSHPVSGAATSSVYTGTASDEASSSVEGSGVVPVSDGGGTQSTSRDSQRSSQLSPLNEAQMSTTSSRPESVEGGHSGGRRTRSGSAGSGSVDEHLSVFGVHFEGGDEEEELGASVGLTNPTGLQAAPPKCGSLTLTFRYDGRRRRMKVEVVKADKLPDDDRGGGHLAEVQLYLTPARKTRHKTHSRPCTAPTFNERFEFRVSPDQLKTMGLHVRVYGGDRMKRDLLIGEKMIGFGSLGLDPTLPIAKGESPPAVERTLELEPRCNTMHAGDVPLIGRIGRVGALASGSASSVVSSEPGSDSADASAAGEPSDEQAELMIGLLYNDTTGRLAVEVIKGSNFFKPPATKPHDTMVKLALMSATGKELSHGQTTVRRSQPSPTFKETIMFQVPTSQLADVSLLISVYTLHGVKQKSKMLGWFALGRAKTSEEASFHWSSMSDSIGQQVCRWHALLEP